MGLRETDVEKQREEFVRLALKPGANVAELSRRFGISRECACKWIGRFRAEGLDGLRDRSRRPRTSPGRSNGEVEARVLSIRAESNGAWGGRKIAKVMAAETGLCAPAASTVTAILRRAGKLEANAAEHPGPWTRFERSAPNALWQMDYKGHFAMTSGQCHPLTAIDDHSRYSIGLEACADQTTETVATRLTACFRRYGLPNAILCDNGSPWGSCGDDSPHTRLSVWLLRLGIAVHHGRPCHPQTQGKDERFHRTLKAEVLNGRSFADIAAAQGRFDAWRHRYNHLRPHEALGLETPATRCRPSERGFPGTLPAIDHGEGAIVRTVNTAAVIGFENRSWCAGRPFVGEPVAIRPQPDGTHAVYYCAHRIGTIDNRLVAKEGSHPLIRPPKPEKLST